MVADRKVDFFQGASHKLIFIFGFVLVVWWIWCINYYLRSFGLFPGRSGEFFSVGRNPLNRWFFSLRKESVWRAALAGGRGLNDFMILVIVIVCYQVTGRAHRRDDKTRHHK